MKIELDKDWSVHVVKGNDGYVMHYRPDGAEDEVTSVDVFTCFEDLVYALRDHFAEYELVVRFGEECDEEMD